MKSRYRLRGIGAATAKKVIPLHLTYAQLAPSTAAAAAAPPASSSSSPGFWDAATTGEKVAIGLGSALAAGLLYLAIKK